MTQPTPDQLERARKAAAAYWQTGDVGDESSARSILSGEWDDMAYTQAALTAILSSDQQQAELKTHAEALDGYVVVLLGEDARFHPMVGGNPNAIVEMLSGAQQAHAAFREYQKGRSDG